MSLLLKFFSQNTGCSSTILPSTSVYEVEVKWKSPSMSKEYGRRLHCYCLTWLRWAKEGLQRGVWFHDDGLESGRATWQHPEDSDSVCPMWVLSICNFLKASLMRLTCSQGWELCPAGVAHSPIHRHLLQVGWKPLFMQTAWYLCRPHSHPRPAKTGVLQSKAFPQSTAGQTLATGFSSEDCFMSKSITSVLLRAQKWQQ